MACKPTFFGLLTICAALCAVLHESSAAVAPPPLKAPTSDNGTDRSTTAEPHRHHSTQSSETSLPTNKPVTLGRTNVGTQPNNNNETSENKAVDVSTNSTGAGKTRLVKRDDFRENLDDSMMKRFEEMTKNFGDDSMMKHFEGTGNMEGADVVSVKKCCFNDDCRDLKDGEECSEALFPDAPKTRSRKISIHSSTTRRKTSKFAGDPGESVASLNLNENSIKKIREKVLEKSNFYRKKHGIKPLELDTKMNNYAQTWANHLEGKGLIHRTNNRIYGENLYGTTDPNNVGEKAVSSWYNEISLFNPNDNEDQLYRRSSIHHMTQLLWKSSKKMGVGVSKGKNGWYTVVANYDPPGNFKDNFKQNLPKISRK